MKLTSRLPGSILSNAVLGVSASLSLSLLVAPHLSQASPDDVTFPRPVLRAFAPDQVFAPPGFDANDSAEIVLTGTFMNSCHQVAEPQVEIDFRAKTIRIKDQAYRIESDWCLMVLVPYQKVVKLGILSPGEYEISVNRADGSYSKIATLPVDRAKPTVGRDDFLYASVQSARLERTAEPLQPQLKMAILLTDRCMSIQEVKVLTRTRNIIEVLPVVAMRSPTAEEPCGPALSTQEVTQPLSLPWTGDSLIHIRSAGGQSHNVVYTP